MFIRWVFLKILSGEIVNLIENPKQVLIPKLKLFCILSNNFCWNTSYVKKLVNFFCSRKLWRSLTVVKILIHFEMTLFVFFGKELKFVHSQVCLFAVLLLIFFQVRFIFFVKGRRIRLWNSKKVKRTKNVIDF